jgi:hypothetical protein
LREPCGATVAHRDETAAGVRIKLTLHGFADEQKASSECEFEFEFEFPALQVPRLMQ